MISTKNLGLDPGLGLGDGDMLQEQAAQQILARRKKLMGTPDNGQPGIADNLQTPGAQYLNGGAMGAPSLGLF